MDAGKYEYEISEKNGIFGNRQDVEHFDSDVQTTNSSNQCPELKGLACDLVGNSLGRELLSSF